MRLVLFQPDNRENLGPSLPDASEIAEKRPRRVFIRPTTGSVARPGQVWIVILRSRSMILATLVFAAVFVVIVGQRAIENSKSR